MSAGSCPIIWLASEDWAPHDAQASYHITRILGRERRILFVNSIGIRRPTASANDLHRIIQRVQKLFVGTRLAAPNLWILSPAGLPASLGAWTMPINEHLVSTQIRRACNRAGIDLSRAVFWASFPGWAPIIRRLGVDPARLVLHFFDRWEAYHGVDRGLVVKMRNDLIRAAGAVLVSGGELADELAHDHPRVFHTPHGVDLGLFNNADIDPAPNELASLPRPIAGFIGTVDSIWLDYRLLHAAAKRSPDISWVFIGRTGLTHPADSAVLRDLLALPNVHYLGPREHRLMPRFVGQFNVGLLPFNVTDLSRSASPLKLLEYLSMGLPVVSTLDQQYGDLARFVTVAGETPESFANTVRSLAMHPTEDAEERREACVSYDWESVVTGYLRLLERSGIALDSC